MSAVGDVIQPGQPIPDDVTRGADKDGHIWERQPGGRWFCVTTHFGTTSIEADVLSREWGPLTVTAVREQPAEPARHAFVQGGADSKRCKRVFGTMFCGFGPGDFPHQCTQCGQPFTGRACGPTHALMATGQLDEIIADATPRELPAEPEPVHYYVPEFSGPSGATLCGLGIEEDMSTTGEAGKATCGACRAAACEEPAEPEPPFPTSPHPYERGPYAVDGAQVCGICGGRRAASVHRGYDGDGFLRLKGTATGDNQLDPEPVAVIAHFNGREQLLDGVLAEPQQQQADVSPVLDLVWKYGDERAAEMRGDLNAGPAADALWTRITALVPQQPVQARDEFGIPLFIHACGTVMPESVSGVQKGEHHCYPPCPTPGPWRPLLAGGDPAPERCTAISGLHGTRCIYLVQDERHEANDDDRTRHEDENGFVWIAVRSGGDRAPEVDGQRLDAQRAWLHRELLAITAQRDEYASKLGEAHADLDEARAEVEHERKNSAYLHEIIAEFKAAQPDPLVLSLPEVPEGTVALTGVESGRRWTLYDGPLARLSPRQWEHGGMIRDDQSIFAQEPGGVRVELAPPREPRTWPKLDDAPDGVRKVEVRRPDGTQFVCARRRDGNWAAAIAFADPENAELHETFTWGEMLGEGDVTEVTE